MTETLAPDSTSATTDRPIHDVGDDICRLAGQIAAATALFLALVAEFDDRQGWADWQCRSCAHWLSWKAGVDLHTAREYVRVAAALRTLPATSEAFAAGRVSFSKVRAVTRVANRHTEQDLLNTALSSTAAQVEQLCRGLKKQTRPDTDRCTGYWRWDEDGTLVFTARFNAEDGTRVLAGLTRAEIERTRTAGAEPDLTAHAPQNPVPAMVAMAETICDTVTFPTVSPAAEVLVHVHDDRPAHVDNGPGLDDATVEQLVCSATLRLVSHGKLGQTVKLSTPHRTPTRLMLRTLVQRDQCCAVPGCGRTKFLKAHHVTFWSRGGATDLNNLIMLCSEHHTALHDGEFDIIARGDQQFTLQYPSGHRILYAPNTSGDAADLQDRFSLIEPETIIPDWDGSYMNYSYATDVMLRNWEQQAKDRESANQAA